MIIVETDHTSGAAQTIAGEVLGFLPGVSQAGRLGVEIAFPSLDQQTIQSLEDALGANGHEVYVIDTSRTASGDTESR